MFGYGAYGREVGVLRGEQRSGGSRAYGGEGGPGGWSKMIQVDGSMEQVQNISTGI